MYKIIGADKKEYGPITADQLRQWLAEGRVNKTDRVVLFNCGNGLKYPMPDTNLRVDRHKPVDYARL